MRIVDGNPSRAGQLVIAQILLYFQLTVAQRIAWESLQSGSSADSFANIFGNEAS